jgi:hypothetical protein
VADGSAGVVWGRQTNPSPLRTPISVGEPSQLWPLRGGETIAPVGRFRAGSGWGTAFRTHAP